MRRVALVVTTIFEPRFLDGYLDAAERNGGEIDIIVIPDLKTPASVADACAAARKRGFRVSCPDESAQVEFLRRFPGMGERIPWNSDNRRNVGFLMALDSGAEVVISIDDDNLCEAGTDFFGEHLRAGKEAEATEISSDDGWLNLCDWLDSSTRAEIYPRGFPYFARRRPRRLTRKPAAARRVLANVGLWTGDPDVDAVTRLALAPKVISARSEPFFLGKDTWTPINTQNTAIAREAMPAYYYVRMLYPVGGLSLDRFGDILSGYFLQKCLEACGGAIRIGPPVALHDRTPHNLFKDLSQELAGIVMLEELIPWLRELPLSASSPGEAYVALSDSLREAAPRFRGWIWDEGGREFLIETAVNMEAWLKAVAVIG